jgi:tetratricopeptide (TPR) repeat protein
MKIIIFVISLIIASSAFANNLQTEISKGNYTEAITILNADSGIADQSYFLGICYSRLQEFDKAILSFQKSVEEKSSKTDLYYEYGQALYAANELKKARSQFQESFRLNFNPAGSLYYIGHISQMLEEYKQAQASFEKIIRDYSSDLKMKQIALFQFVETTLILMKDKSPENIAKYIIPSLKKAQATIPDTTVANDIEKRIIN